MLRRGTANQPFATDLLTRRLFASVGGYLWPRSRPISDNVDLNRLTSLPYRALDPAIAGLTVLNRSNDTTSGAEIAVHVSFGMEFVELTDGAKSLRAKMSMRHALLYVEPVSNCRLSPISSDDADVRHHNHSYKRGYGEERTRQIASAIELEGELEAIASPGVADGVKGTTLGQLALKRARISNTADDRVEGSNYEAGVPYTRVSQNALKVGLDGKTLVGTYIQGEARWRIVRTSSNAPYAVAARLATRADWVEFDKISALGGWARKSVQALELLASSKDRFQFKLFQLLLAKLASKGLSSTLTPNEATVAYSGLVFELDQGAEGEVQEKPLALVSEAPTLAVPIDASRVETFLSTPTRQRVAMLLDEGVSRADIVGASQQDGKPKTDARLFFGDSAPPKAKQALEYLVEHGSVDANEIAKLFGSKTNGDLGALGLVKVSNGKASTSLADPDEVEHQLRHRVKRQPAIQVGRELWIQYDEPEDMELFGRAVAARFGKTDYRAATFKKLGANVRRWALWDDPYLIDPTRSALAARLHASALSDDSQIGAFSRSRDEALIGKFVALMSEGLTLTEAAERLRVPRSTAFLWKKEGRFEA